MKHHWLCFAEQCPQRGKAPTFSKFPCLRLQQDDPDHLWEQLNQKNEEYPLKFRVIMTRFGHKTVAQ